MNHQRDFEEKYDTEALMIAENAAWRWSLRPTQCTLGAGLIAARSPLTALGAMTSESALLFAEITALAEQVTRVLLTPDKFNHLSLMMIDPHLHFHFVPRYASERISYDQTFVDSGWPGFPALGVSQGGANLLSALLSDLRSCVATLPKALLAHEASGSG